MLSLLQISMLLSEFHEWVRKVVRFACEKALEDENFVPDPIVKEGEGNVTIHCCCKLHTYTLIICLDLESNNAGVMHLDGSPIVGDKPFQTEPLQLDKKEKMTYTEQAAKRKHCQRLTRFVAT